VRSEDAPGADAGLTDDRKAGETFLQAYGLCCSCSLLPGALVTLLSFLWPAEALRLTPNCPKFSTTLISSLARDLPPALYPNKIFARYLLRPNDKPVKMRYRFAAVDFLQPNSTCISKEALNPLRIE